MGFDQLKRFRTLPAVERELRAAATAEVGASTGTTVFAEGTLAEHVWAAQSGLIHIVKHGPQGRQVILCVAVPSRLPRLLTFAAAEVEALARLQHERWYAERRAKGWRRGEAKDLMRKRHPDLVPWDDASETLREWNRQTILALPEVLARADLEIQRVDGPLGDRQE